MGAPARQNHLSVDRGISDFIGAAILSLSLSLDSMPSDGVQMMSVRLNFWPARAVDVVQIGTLYYERLLASKDRQPVKEEAKANLATLPVTPRDFI